MYLSTHIFLSNNLFGLCLNSKECVSPMPLWLVLCDHTIINLFSSFPNFYDLVISTPDLFPVFIYIKENVLL